MAGVELSAAQQEAFATILDYQTTENRTLRDALREHAKAAQMKGKLTPKDLADICVFVHQAPTASEEAPVRQMAVADAYDALGSDKNPIVIKQLGDFNEALIQEANRSKVGRNLGKFLGSTALATVLAFGLSAGIMIGVGGAVPAIVAAMSFLSFLVPFGPVIGALIFAAILAAATMTVYMLGGAVMAAATGSSMEFHDPVNPPASNNPSGPNLQRSQLDNLASASAGHKLEQRTPQPVQPSGVPAGGTDSGPQLLPQPLSPVANR